MINRPLPPLPPLAEHSTEEGRIRRAVAEAFDDAYLEIEREVSGTARMFALFILLLIVAVGFGLFGALIHLLSR